MPYIISIKVYDVELENWVAKVGELFFLIKKSHIEFMVECGVIFLYVIICCHFI